MTSLLALIHPPAMMASIPHWPNLGHPRKGGVCRGYELLIMRGHETLKAGLEMEPQMLGVNETCHIQPTLLHAWTTDLITKRQLFPTLSCYLKVWQ